MDEKRLEQANNLIKKIEKLKLTLDHANRSLEWMRRKESIKGYEISIVRTHVDSLVLPLEESEAHRLITKHRDEVQKKYISAKKDFEAI